MKEIVVFLLVLCSALSGSSQPSVFAFLGDEPDNVRTIDGEVTELDWVGQTLTVRWMNPSSDRWRNTTFSITEDVPIMRGTSKLSFSDLNMGDGVNISYVLDESGEPKLKKIVADVLSNQDDYHSVY